jgi:hypothetical protein
MLVPIERRDEAVKWGRPFPFRCCSFAAGPGRADPEVPVFIVELTTTTGKVCESYPTYEEALRRVEQVPAESLAGLPLIFQELPDGSQRLVRDDGKPLQWHRLEEDRAAPGPDDPLPLADESTGLLGEGRWVPMERPGPQEDWDDEPLLPP